VENLKLLIDKDHIVNSKLVIVLISNFLERYSIFGCLCIWANVV